MRPSAREDRRACLFGIDFSALTRAQVLERCRDAVLAGGRLSLGVVNAAKLVRMRADAELRHDVLGADLVLADGQSVVWASRLLGRPLPERVAGIEVFEDLLAQAEEHGRAVYLLGAKPAVLASLLERVAARHPRLRVAGSRDGYFGPEDEPEVAAEIRASGADYLFVGITSPKKERFLARWGDELGVVVTHGVGGSFDVLAGLTKRAPRAWQRLGLEWLYRVVQEPRRLWRRYLVTNSLFLLLLVRERFARTTPYARDDGGHGRPSARTA